MAFKTLLQFLPLQTVAIIFLAFVAGFAAIPIVAAQETHPVSQLPEKLQNLITELKAAVEDRNGYAVARAVSPDFAIERDFGGIFNPQNNAFTNFLMAFPLDNSLIMEEYHGIGWQQFSAFLDSDVFYDNGDGEFCLPAGGEVAHIVSVPWLCFAEREQGSPYSFWQISRNIRAGD